jgi:hypothetical protein
VLEPGLAHLYAFCKGGDYEVGHHSFSLQMPVSWRRVETSPAILRNELHFITCTNQSVWRDKDEIPGVGGMSPHLYKERKGGAAALSVI